MSDESIPEKIKPNNKVRKEEASSTTPFVRYKLKNNEKTQKEQLVLELSNGDKIDNQEALEKLKKTFKVATGTDGLALADHILQSLASGMSDSLCDSRLNRLLMLLPALKPQNETEALLLGQFIALQDSGFKCLRRANDAEGFYHLERFHLLATKLLRTANETMQTLLKYRNGGKQEIQIVHLHNEGQAILAQNISNGGGGCEKNQ